VDQTVSPLAARRSGPLKGRVRVPGDKSISHRALILGALTVGQTEISGLLEGEDVINTSKAMAALGAQVERVGEGAWDISGVGVGGYRQPAATFDFGNSGIGCRLVTRIALDRHPTPRACGARPSPCRGG
jgi:3-phosphoshikimate 1-carboxyvinyltransferase